MTFSQVANERRRALAHAKSDFVYRAILDFWAEHGYSPSTRELVAATGTSSTSLIRYHLLHLEARGLITMKDDTARSIVVVGSTWSPPPALAALDKYGPGTVALGMDEAAVALADFDRQADAHAEGLAAENARLRRERDEARAGAVAMAGIVIRSGVNRDLRGAARDILDCWGGEEKSS